MPDMTSWPLNTFLHLEVALDQTVLQSILRGYWPAQHVSIANPKHSGQTVLEGVFPVEEMLLLNVHLIETLGLSVYINLQHCYSKREGGYREKLICNFRLAAIGPGLHRLCSAFVWPALREVYFNHNQLGDKLVLLLTAAKWPLLAMLDLSFNKLTADGAKGLITGDWPMLAVLKLEGNKFNKLDWRSTETQEDQEARVRRQEEVLSHLRSKHLWHMLCVIFQKEDDFLFDASGAFNLGMQRKVDSVVDMS